ncbi:glucokinase [Octadecabacter sp.]|nr:glucokinase [Octadecabacter sp.]
MRLVADIGGTNTRLALCQDRKIVPHTLRSFANDDWGHLYEIIKAFLGVNSTDLDDMVLAVAGPVVGERATLTNRNWTIDRAELQQLISCPVVHLMNDLSALGYATPSLKEKQLHVLFEASGISAECGQYLVVGIGTGFNVSPVLKTFRGTHCLSAEAGHVTLPNSISVMIEKKFGTEQHFFSIEDLFSGRGFQKFCGIATGQENLQGKAVIQSYGDHVELANAVDCYAEILGQLLRELTLAYMPTQGIYLAGSVARAIMKTAPLACLKVFSNPYEINAASPPNLLLIEDDFAALHGCAVFKT